MVAERQRRREVKRRTVFDSESAMMFCDLK